jgi:hypothetical protein
MYFQQKTYGILELRYIKKGGSYSTISPLGSQVMDYINLHYAEIPVMIGSMSNLYINNEERKFIIEAGIAFAKLFSVKPQLNRYDYSPLISFKKLDASWVIKLKFPSKTKNKNLLFGIRTSGSVFSIHEKFNLKNTCSGMELAYTFR